MIIARAKGVSLAWYWADWIVGVCWDDEVIFFNLLCLSAQVRYRPRKEAP